MGHRNARERGCVATLALCIGLLLAPRAAAVPLAEWDLANATGQSAAVLWTHADVTATAIGASADLNPWASTAQDGFIAASDWAPGLAPDPTKYYEWTVTPGAGMAITYETLTLALFRGIQGASHGAQRWDLRASSDGFASSNLFLDTFDISASGVDEQVIFGADVSALGTASATVTFRLFGYDYTSPSDFSGLGNDSGWLISGTGINPVIGGSVVVNPEPRSALLLAFGLLLLARWRRRRP